MPIPNFGSPVIGNTTRKPLPILNLTFDGNSLSALPGNYTETFQLAIKPGYQTIKRNFAVSGQTTVQMASDATVQINRPEHVDKAYNIINVWEGTNDIFFGATGQTAYNNIRQYCLNRKAYGFKVITGTVTPRSENGLPAGFETQRQLFNTLIRTYWFEFADAYHDVGGHELLGANGASDNLTYYVDKVHYTTLGHSLVQAIIARAVNSLLP